MSVSVSGSLEWRKLPLQETIAASLKVKESKGQKQERLELPFLRYGHSVVEFEGKIYLWGGRNDVQGACRKLFCFDTSKLLYCNFCENVIFSRKFKGRIGSLFDPCVNAIGQQPY